MALIDLLLAINILPENLFKPNLILGNLYTIIPTIWSIITTAIDSKVVQNLFLLDKIYDFKRRLSNITYCIRAVFHPLKTDEGWEEIEFEDI